MGGETLNSKTTECVAFSERCGTDKLVLCESLDDLAGLCIPQLDALVKGL